MIYGADGARLAALNPSHSARTTRSSRSRSERRRSTASSVTRVRRPRTSTRVVIPLAPRPRRPPRPVPSARIGAPRSLVYARPADSVRHVAPGAGPQGSDNEAQPGRKSTGRPVGVAGGRATRLRLARPIALTADVRSAIGERVAVAELRPVRLGRDFVYREDLSAPPICLYLAPIDLGPSIYAGLTGFADC